MLPSSHTRTTTTQSLLLPNQWHIESANPKLRETARHWQRHMCSSSPTQHSRCNYTYFNLCRHRQIQKTQISALSLMRHVILVRMHWSTRHLAVPSTSSVPLRPVQHLKNYERAESGDASRAKQQVTSYSQPTANSLSYDPQSQQISFANYEFSNGMLIFLPQMFYKTTRSMWPWSPKNFVVKIRYG